MIENSGDAIFLFYKSKFELVNEKFYDLFELTPGDLQTPDYDFLNNVDQHSRSLIFEKVRNLSLNQVFPQKFEFFGLTKSGKRINIEATVTYLKYKDGIAVQGILRDVSERKHLEEQLRQSQKMEMVGQLAGGVAHDFNNLLTVISGFSELILIEPDLDPQLKDKIVQIKMAGERAHALTNQLLAFSRKQVMKLEVLDVKEMLEKSIKLYRRLIDEDINIKITLKENLPRILADPNQIEQILMNLLVNARDAVRSRDKISRKEITIKSSKTIIRKNQDILFADLAPGNYVQLEIQDNGIGMNEETRNKIFEPFFTTKRQGAGTGLGLSTVYGIIKQNNASILVESEVNVGTVFKIYWPTEYVLNESSEKELPVKTKIKKGNETILIVEDDKDVMNFTRSALEASGYMMKFANSGEEVLEMLENNDKKIDLIISDVVLEGMNGIELYRKLKARNFKIPFIFVSGYTDGHLNPSVIDNINVSFFHKPYKLVDLSRQIRTMLDRQ